MQWAGTAADIFNLPGAAGFAETFRPGPELFFVLKRLPEWFIAAPGARYFYMLAAGVAGLVAMGPGRRGFAPLFGAMALLCPLALFLSTISSQALFTGLLVMPFVLLFAAGSGAILKETVSAARPWVRGLRPLILVLLIGAAAWAVHRTPAGAFHARPVLADQFAARWHAGLRRDAAAFINPEYDDFLLPAAVSVLRNTRRDVAYVYPRNFNDSEYRAAMRRSGPAGLAVPSEKQYAQLRNTVTESTRAPEGAPEDSVLMKQRVLYNLMMLNQTIMAEETARRRPVYFNTISMFLRNERFNWMCFVPEKLLFRACHTQFAPCVDQYLRASPDIRARIEQKKRELLRDRAFLEQAVRDKYASAPAYAAPVLELLEQYFKRGEPALQEDIPWPAPDDGQSLAAFLQLEELIVQKVIHPYVALIQEAAMSCDASREGFSLECVARNMLDIMGRTDVDLFPMPEAAAYCFIKSFHWPWPEVEQHMQDALHSPLRRDPVAARILAGHLADAAEHAWIHKNPYLHDDDPEAESGAARTGYGAALSLRSAALRLAVALGVQDIDAAALPVIERPDIEESHLQLLLENAVRLAPDNVRARFLLAMVAMEKNPHGAVAQEQLQAVERMLKEREARAGLDDYEMYMLVETYQKMGLRDQAEKYLQRLEGGSRLPVY